MTFARLLDSLIENTLSVSLPAFGAELIVCATVLALLLGRLFEWERWLAPRWLACAGATAACVYAVMQISPTFHQGRSTAEFELLFTQLLIDDPLTVFMRVLLTGFLALTTWLTAISGVPDREDGPDFHALLFGCTLGSLLMVQSNHLLMLFLAIEMASVPGYVLVGFQKGRQRSGEAALKYLVYGAGAAGILLYGVSLLAGSLGTALLPEMASRVALIWETSGGSIGSPMGRTVLLGILLVFVGIAFKLALVPFHFWCPDAFEGATAEVAGFLSVAPKAAAFALLIRFVQSVLGAQSIAVEEVRFGLGIGLAILSALTMTLGNLTAFEQSNVKRLFAYSTIAHAGYLLMGVAAWMVAGEAIGRVGIEGILYYLVVYVFMNLGAFGMIALIRNATFGETIEDYRGIGMSLPIPCAAMVICCMSLIGIWPAGGFIGKFMVFSASMSAGWSSAWLWGLVGVAVLNTAWSVFYYARVVRAMYRPTDAALVRPLSASEIVPSNLFAIAISVPIVMLGIWVQPVSEMASFVARSLLP